MIDANVENRIAAHLEMLRTLRKLCGGDASTDHHAAVRLAYAEDAMLESVETIPAVSDDISNVTSLTEEQTRVLCERFRTFEQDVYQREQSVRTRACLGLLYAAYDLHLEATGAMLPPGGVIEFLTEANR
jgi:hypothetical protein